MKKNINVIQIKGIKGIIVAGFIVSCLAAGFIVFPGWIGMYAWNYVSSLSSNIPSIGLFQGILLWGIIIAAYFTFRKEKVIVCMKSPQGLSDDELKAVFADIKKQAQEDPIMQAMMRAREAELKYKAQEKNDNNDSENAVASDNSKV